MDLELPPLPARYSTDTIDATDANTGVGTPAGTGERSDGAARIADEIISVARVLPTLDQVTPVPDYVRLDPAGVADRAPATAAPTTAAAGTAPVGRRAVVLAALAGAGAMLVVIALIAAGTLISMQPSTTPQAAATTAATSPDEAGTPVPSVPDSSAATKAALQTAFDRLAAASVGAKVLADPTTVAGLADGGRLVTGPRGALAADEIHVVRSPSGDSVCLHGQTAKGTWYTLAAFRMPTGEVQAHYDWSAEPPGTLAYCNAGAVRDLTTTPW